MRYATIGENYKVSKVGIGGHYSKMEEGRFEHNYAEVTAEEVKARTALIERAFDAGINYFDSTWRNESDMLAKTLEPLHIRDKIFINGMVLGTFRGSKAFGISPEAYMNQWLDARLKHMPGGYFDSFMINAIEEDYSPEACEQVIQTLEKRKQQGDIRVIGFSCHDHRLAREIADQFPQFELIMTAYNYKNRSFEKAFDGYTGNASFVAMKPLIWYEYGVPFCRMNDLPEESAEALLRQKKVPDIASKAVKWNLRNPMITTCVCAVNSEEELEDLIAAGNGECTVQEVEALEAYRQGIEAEKHIPYLIAAILNSQTNRRSFFFGLSALAHSIGYPFPQIGLNAPDSDAKLAAFREELIPVLREKGYGAYLK